MKNTRHENDARGLEKKYDPSNANVGRNFHTSSHLIIKNCSRYGPSLLVSISTSRSFWWAFGRPRLKLSDYKTGFFSFIMRRFCLFWWKTMRADLFDHHEDGKCVFSSLPNTSSSRLSLNSCGLIYYEDAWGINFFSRCFASTQQNRETFFFLSVFSLLHWATDGKKASRFAVTIYFSVSTKAQFHFFGLGCC